MNKKEWINHWRNLRTNRIKTELQVSTCVKILRELYEYNFLPEQQVFINLTERYKDKVPNEFFERIEGWKPEAKRRAMELMCSLIYSKNPFMSSIPKSGFEGKYLPIPIKLGK